MCRDTYCTIKNKWRNFRMKCKRFLAMLCCICIAFCCGTSTSAASPIEVIGSPRVDLHSYIESLSEEECVAFLEESDVHVPEFFVDENGRPSVKGVVLDILENPYSWMANLTEANKFFDDVRALLASYAIGGYYAQTQETQTYVMQYSSKYFWNSYVTNFNCYAYALGKSDKFYDPGEFSGNTYNTISDDPVYAANLVKEDLYDLGYECVSIKATCPTSNGIWDSIIAVKVDTDFDCGYYNDYHFARLVGSDWRHKPAGTAILQFNSASTVDANEWCNERIINNTAYEPTIWYESDTIYICYSQDHTTTYTGNNYHSGNQHYCQYRYTCGCSLNGTTFWEHYACSGNPCITPNSITPPSEVSR